MLTKRDLIKTQQPYAAVCGVYFLLLDNELVYIGQSTNVHARLKQHFSSGREFDAYVVEECKKRELDDREGAYIAEFLPSGNLAMTKEARALATKRHSRPVNQIW